jgi:hypothetical protein
MARFVLPVFMLVGGCGKVPVSGQIFLTDQNGGVQKIAGAEVVFLSEAQALAVSFRADQSFADVEKIRHAEVHSLRISADRERAELARLSDLEKRIVSQLSEVRIYFEAAEVRLGPTSSLPGWAVRHDNVHGSEWRAAVEQWRKVTKRDELDQLEEMLTGVTSELRATGLSAETAKRAYSNIKNGAETEAFEKVIRALFDGGSIAQCRTDADGRFAMDLPRGKIALLARSENQLCFSRWINVPENGSILCSNDSLLGANGSTIVYKMRPFRW